MEHFVGQPPAFLSNEACLGSTLEKMDQDPGRDGTFGRHEPPLCRHEPPRFARQTKPLLCKKMSMRNTSKCACNTEGSFKLVF